MKLYLNYEKFKDPNAEIDKTEQMLSLVEAGTEVFQILASLADLTAG